MATPTTFATSKQFINVAKEVTQGTAVLTGMTSIPIDSFSPEDKPTWLDDGALRNAMAQTYGRIQGPLHTEFDLAGPAFMDSLPFFINNIMGDIATTGASAPFTHAISLLNSGTGQPGSLTIVAYDGMTATTGARSYPGACLSELTITGNADSAFIGMSAKGMGWPSADVPTTPPTVTYSAAPPMPTWRYALGLGGTAVGAPDKTVREFSLTIARDLRVENTMQNSQSPFIIQRGQLSVSGSLTFTVPSTEAALNDLLNNTQPQLQIAGLQGTGGTTLGLTVDMQLCAFDTTKIKTDEQALGYDVTFIGVANATNTGASGGFSPLKLTVQNALPANTY